jgi:hypothetical protein
LFEQVVVEVGQRFEHLLARLAFALLDRLRHFDQVRGLALLVAEGPLAHQVDEAGHLVTVADRHLAQHQRPGRDRLERVHQVLHAHVDLVHLVDEEHVRDLVVVEEAEDRPQGKGPLQLRLGDHDRNVGRHQGVAAFLAQLDRAGTVDEAPLLAQILGMGEVGLDAHLPGARLGRAVAQGAAFGDRALAVDRAGREQQALEQRCLAARIGADEHGTARRGYRLCGHVFLPFFGPAAEALWRVFVACRQWFQTDPALATEIRKIPASKQGPKQGPKQGYAPPGALVL